MEVWEHNYESALVAFKREIDRCEFVSVDLEFSGLRASSESRKPCLFDEPETRYAPARDTARLFTPFQLGLCTFRRVSDKPDAELVAMPFAFNLLPLAQERDSFTVQATSLRFLAEHKFDFNTLFSDGISDGRRIVEILMSSKRPICAHNCLLDICFILENFVSRLPDDVQAFKTLVQESFGVIFDTKLICLKSEIVRGLFESTWLDKAYNRVLVDSRFDGPSISLSPEIKEFVGVEMAHDAGFDAYMTGVLFAKISSALRNENLSVDEHATERWIDERVDWSSRDISSFANRVFLGRSFRHLYLGGLDLVSFKAVVRVDVKAPVNSSHIISAFRKVSDRRVRVMWHNDTTAFVSLGADMVRQAPSIVDRLERFHRKEGQLSFVLLA